VPNPFNPVTKIAFELPKKGEVEVVIYNVAGREVVTLHKGELPAGPHSLTWDGRTSGGSMAASGAYWYLLRTPDGQTSRSMVLLK
jgi:flagellar hook assembly protein FlgD